MMYLMLSSCLLFVLPVPSASVDEEEGFVALFDGKSLEGWEGNKDLWKVEDQMIVGKSPGLEHNHFLCTKGEFEDFELRLEFRLVDGKGNSGVQFRSKRVPGSTEVSGYQADLGDGYWGCLYDESRRNRVLVQASSEELDKVLEKDGWNSYSIRAVADHIVLRINDHTTVDYREQDKDIARKGVIGIQVHAGPPFEVQFRKIRIKKLER